MNALSWRGQPIDPAVLLAKYHCAVSVAPNPAWHIVELRETHGRPELRQIVLDMDGTSVAFTATSNAGLTLDNLRSSMKEEGNLMNLDVNVSSYYYPRKEAGPWTIRVRDGGSDSISGLGLAVDPPGDNPGQDEDSRYLTLQCVWKYGTSTDAPIPVPQPTPDPAPVPTPTPPTAFDLVALQKYVDARIDQRLAETLARIKAAL